MSAACPACVAVPAAEDIAAQTTANVTLSVPAMHCAVCMRKVEDTLNALPGVTGARVNLTLRRVSAHSDRPEADLVQALADVGYEAFAFDLGTLEGQSDPIGRNLLIRLGVAGFAMMNVMLLSVAVWSGAQDATRDLLHLIAALIALPAAAFSAQPFFINAWAALRHGRLNMDVPISLAIILAALMSLYESLNGGQHAYFDAALSLTFFLLIGRYLEHRTKRSARSAAGDLAALEVHKTQRWKGTKLTTIPINDLKTGDLVHVAAGARVPADGLLTSEYALTNRSFLTGESAPVDHRNGASLSAGEINIGAPFSMRAEAVGEDTTLRQMARLVEAAENVRNRYTNLADRAAKIYAPAVHLLAAAAFLGWWVGSGDPRLALNIAIAVLIITCPCALGLAVPAVSTAAIGKLFQKGFLVKSGVALERLSEVDEVVFDKTGTLTNPEASLDLHHLTQSDKAIAVALAQRSEHPIARAVAQALQDVEPAALTEVRELKGNGIEALAGTRPVRLGRASWIGSPGKGTALAIGSKVKPIAHQDILRPGALNAIAGIAKLDLPITLLSGDTKEKTLALAQSLNIQNASWGQTPTEKANALKQRADAGSNVCMIGDGLNDTLALASAHASIAPGSALNAARNAADIILVKEDLSELAEVFSTARMAVHLSRQNFAIAALYNAIAIPVALAGLATPFLAALAMSLSSLTVLINAFRVRA